MKRNLFVLMLSTFVLTSAQQSYAVKPGEEENKSSQKWVRKAPIRDKATLEFWEEKVKKAPHKYKFKDNELFILEE